MTRIERIFAVIAFITERKCFNKSQIATRFGVSRATLQRDLQFIRDRVGINIVYDHFDECYKVCHKEINSDTQTILAKINSATVYLDGAEVRLLLRLFSESELKIDNPNLKKLICRMERAIKN